MNVVQTQQYAENYSAAIQQLLEVSKAEAQRSKKNLPSPATMLNLSSLYIKVGKHEEAFDNANSALLQLLADRHQNGLTSELQQLLAVAYHNTAVTQEYSMNNAIFRGAAENFKLAITTAEETLGARHPTTKQIKESYERYLGKMRKRRPSESSGSSRSAPLPIQESSKRQALPKPPSSSNAKTSFKRGNPTGSATARTPAAPWAAQIDRAETKEEQSRRLFENERRKREKQLLAQKEKEITAKADELFDKWVKISKQQESRKLRIYARKIQSVWRGYRTRCDLRLQHQAATLAQATVRSYLTRKRIWRDTQEEIKKLQEEKFHLMMESCVIKIQKVTRGWLSKRYVRRVRLARKKRMFHCARRIQRCFRNYVKQKARRQEEYELLLKERLAKERKRQYEAAVLIQRQWRSYSTYKKTKSDTIEALKRVKAAVDLQRMYRGYLVRRFVKAHHKNRHSRFIDESALKRDDFTNRFEEPQDKIPMGQVLSLQLFIFDSMVSKFTSRLLLEVQSAFSALFSCSKESVMIDSSEQGPKIALRIESISTGDASELLQPERYEKLLKEYLHSGFGTSVLLTSEESLTTLRLLCFPSTGRDRVLPFTTKTLSTLLECEQDRLRVFSSKGAIFVKSPIAYQTKLMAMRRKLTREYQIEFKTFVYVVIGDEPGDIYNDSSQVIQSCWNMWIRKRVQKFREDERKREMKRATLMKIRHENSQILKLFALRCLDRIKIFEKVTLDRKHYDSSTAIQSMWRGHRARKEVHHLKMEEKRRAQEHENYLRHFRAANTLQRLGRSYIDRALFARALTDKKRAAVVQAFCRACISAVGSARRRRVMFDLMIGKALVEKTAEQISTVTDRNIQSTVDYHNERRNRALRRIHEDSSCTKIQALWKGFATRKQVNLREVLLLRAQSAKTIQRGYRSYVVRKSANDRRRIRNERVEAVKIVQKNWRKHRSRLELDARVDRRLKWQSRHTAAATIQVYVLATLSAFWVKETSELAVAEAVEEHRARKSAIVTIQRFLRSRVSCYFVFGVKVARADKIAHNIARAKKNSNPHLMNRSAIVIQKTWKGYCDRLVVKWLKFNQRNADQKAAALLQAKLKNVKVVQAMMRSILSVKRLEDLRNRSLRSKSMLEKLETMQFEYDTPDLIAQLFRCCRKQNDARVTRQELYQTEEAREAAAVTIQRRARGMQARGKARAVRSARLRDNACRIIQAKWNEYIPDRLRKLDKRIISAVLLIQRSYRCHRARIIAVRLAILKRDSARAALLLEEMQDRAALTIQRGWKCYTSTRKARLLWLYRERIRVYCRERVAANVIARAYKGSLRSLRVADAAK